MINQSKKRAINWRANGRISLLLLLALPLLAQIGCAEGALWRTGQFAPWVRNQWAAEEQIANSLFERKRQMQAMVESVQGAAVESQQPVAAKLTETVNRDPVLLMRLHAVRLLGDLNCPASVQGLADASSDHISDVRIEAVRSWSRLPGNVAVPRLEQMIASDSDIDVRLAATAAMAGFPGRQSVNALSHALQDRNPALQLRATESLMQLTGEKIGRNVEAWQQYVAGIGSPAENVADSSAIDTGSTTR